MVERVWDRFLTERDRDIFEAAGWAQPQGFGKRPILLIIDVNYNFCGDKPEEILASIKDWPLSCGACAWVAIEHIKALLAAARAKGVPIIYTTARFRPDGWDAGSWNWKNKRNHETVRAARAVDGNSIVAGIAPLPADIVLEKLKPSAFHGTPLRGHLNLLQADSLIICGTTTSGCVRATVLDAFSDNYRVTVAEEACFDRSETSHAINLMDINAKYGDVIPTSSVIDYLNGLEDHPFVAVEHSEMDELKEN